MPFIRSAILLLAAAALGGCASITGSTSQRVTVTPVCEGAIRAATCELSNDKGHWKLQAPGAAQVRKSTADLAVVCRAGPSTGRGSFVSKSNNNVAGNLLAGGLVGLAVDSASGAGFDYPDELPVVLRPPCAAPGTDAGTDFTTKERGKE